MVVPRMNASGIQYCKSSEYLHKEDGPAVVDHDGNQFWFFNNTQHREDGPAVICTNGTRMWYINGQLHREDGPAVMWSSHMIAWYLDGICMEFDEWCEKTNKTDEEKAILKLKYL